tara:strand:+ start:4384 stop:5268 length:885 start_codon:yes stop_codon:yes gene_type:complete
VLETKYDNLQLVGRGKVRDIYDLGESLLLVATDRISAFDVIIPDGIPGKGYVLTQLSAFWFSELWKYNDMIPHHLLSTEVESFPSACHPHIDSLRGRTMLAHKTKPLPVECIVRGYISGSAWKEYRTQGTVCGQRFPRELQESEQFPEPIFTPSTKSMDGHDENISYTDMERLIGHDLAAQVQAASLTIYTHATKIALTHGIVIADTKFEFGIDPKTEQLMLIDEVLTPDSSRFWPKDKVLPGKSPPSLDKQFVRDYLDMTGWDHSPPAPNLPPKVIQQTSEKYLEILSRLTDC